jgi:hypothetical protein
MIGNKRFRFVNNQNYKREDLPEISNSGSPRNVTTGIPDRIRQIIGNYYYIDDKKNLDFQEKKDFPFSIKLGKTINFDTSDLLPSNLKITGITFMADANVFGPYPKCVPCWYRYFFGTDIEDKTIKFDEIYGLDTLKMFDFGSSANQALKDLIFKAITDSTLFTSVARTISLAPPSLQAPLTALLNSKISTLFVRILALFLALLSRAGIPSEKRLEELNYSDPEISGMLKKALESVLGPEQALLELSPIDASGPSDSGQVIQGSTPEPFPNYNIVLFEDSYFKLDAPLTNYEDDEEIANSKSVMKADVDFRYNYAALTYQKFVEKHGLEENKLVNIYALAGKKNIIPIVLKLKNDIECLEKKFITLVLKTPLDKLLVVGDNLPLLNNFYPFKFVVSAYTEIQFDKHRPKEIVTDIQEQKQDGFMLRHLSEAPPIDKTQLYKAFRQLSAQKSNTLLEEPDAQISAWGLNEWFFRLLDESLASDGIPGPHLGFDDLSWTPGVFFFGPRTEAIRLANDTTPPTGYYNKKFRYTVLRDQISKTIQQKNRSFEEIIKGHKPHQEVVAYRISKYSDADFDLNEGDLKEDTMYDKVGELSSPIQNFWFFNSTLADVVSYADSQVKANKQYTYVVHAYLLVVESRYFYYNAGTSTSKRPTPEDPTDETLTAPPIKPSIGGTSRPDEAAPDASDFLWSAPRKSELAQQVRDVAEDLLASQPDPDLKAIHTNESVQTLRNLIEDVGSGRTTPGILQDSPRGDSEELPPGHTTPAPSVKHCEARFLAATVPEPLIFEIPYFIASGRINGDLPVAPDVQFIPYKGIDNKILVNLNIMEGEYRTQFVVINASDQVYYNNLKTQRELNDHDLLAFSSDDDVSAYEVFRIDYHPYGFEDFEKAYYRKFSTALSGKTRPYSNSYSFNEDVEPNRKYYYIFRSVDINGNISNPSRIFELEVVNDGGAVFPIIRAVDFKDRQLKQNSTRMRRLLLFSPTFMQSSINTESMLANGIATARGNLYKALPGNKDEVIWGKSYKIRITSSKTGKSIDINLNPQITYVETSESCGPSAE